MLLPLLRYLFEKIVYRTQAQSVIENNLSHTQFAYRQAGNCTNALFAIQHQTYKYLDSSDCRAVRIFTMAFDFVNHTILSAKLKQHPEIRTLSIGIGASSMQDNVLLAIIF